MYLVRPSFRGVEVEAGLMLKQTRTRHSTSNPHRFLRSPQHPVQSLDNHIDDSKASVRHKEIVHYVGYSIEFATMSIQDGSIMVGLLQGFML